MSLNRSTEDIPRHIQAKNEEELMLLFLAIQQINGKNYNVINIYPKGKLVHMWFYGHTSTIVDVEKFKEVFK